jgi:hypothetical protein
LATYKVRGRKCCPTKVMLHGHGYHSVSTRCKAGAEMGKQEMEKRASREDATQKLTHTPISSSCAVAGVKDRTLNQPSCQLS